MPTACVLETVISVGTVWGNKRMILYNVNPFHASFHTYVMHQKAARSQFYAKSERVPGRRVHPCPAAAPPFLLSVRRTESFLLEERRLGG